MVSAFYRAFQSMFSVLPKEYDFSTAMEVLEYFQGSTAVLVKEYWG